MRRRRCDIPRGQFDQHAAATAGSLFEPGVTARTLGDAAQNGQPDAGPSATRCQPFEDPEHALPVFVFDPRTIVADAIAHRGADSLAGDLDPQGLRTTAMAQGVVEHDSEEFAQARRVDHCGGQPAHFDPGRRLGDHVGKFHQYTAQRLLGIAGLDAAARLIIASLEMAGEAIGLQMGLNFASFFDPVSGGQLSAVSRFLVQTFTLFFIVVNGHIFVLLAVIKSFEAFPVDGHFLDAVAQMRLHELGSALFSSALWLALPMMALLLFVNLTMGVITRIAPQMNIFAVGFPITLTLGMIGITATLPVMEQPFFRLLEQVFAVFGV